MNKFSREKLIKIVIKILWGINIAIVISYFGLFILSIKQDLYWRADFSAFYTGGMIIRSSLGSQLYDLELQKIYQQNIIQVGIFADGLLPFNYPPYVAIFLIPLTYLPLRSAYFVWTIVQILLVIWLLSLLIKISTSWERNERSNLLVFSMAMPSLLISILLGTFSILMLISIFQLYFSLKNNQEIKSGLWLSTLAIKPQIIIIPAIILLSSKRWRPLIVSLLIGFSVFTLTSLMLGSKIWKDFFDRLVFSSTYFNTFGIYPGTMHNFKGALTSIFGIKHADTINAVAYLAFIITSIIVFIIWRGNNKNTNIDIDLKYSLSITLAVLFNIHVNPQDSIILIVPFALFLYYQIKQSYSRHLYLLFLLSIPPILLLSEFWIKDNSIVRLPIIIMIVLSIWISNHLFRDRKFPGNHA
jgi:hypothetical protein